MSFPSSRSDSYGRMNLPLGRSISSSLSGADLDASGRCQFPARSTLRDENGSVVAGMRRHAVSVETGRSSPVFVAILIEVLFEISGLPSGSIPSRSRPIPFLYGRRLRAALGILLQKRLVGGSRNAFTRLRDTICGRVGQKHYRYGENRSSTHLKILHTGGNTTGDHSRPSSTPSIVSTTFARAGGLRWKRGYVGRSIGFLPPHFNGYLTKIRS
jgi:hypothetical protein